jgi:transposase
MLGLATSTLSDLLHRIIERERQGHKIRGLKTIGIDEISYARGHKYATVVYDLDRACVVWVAQGKGRETLRLRRGRLGLGKNLGCDQRVGKCMAVGLKLLT